MSSTVSIGNYVIGDQQPCFIVAEIGINHNGSVELAKKLIDAAAVAGCDAVKFQKRSLEHCVPESQQSVLRETPWGTMTYMEYRRRLEFSFDDYQAIDEYCQERGIMWFASVWDEVAAEFMQEFSPACYKVPSAALTNEALICKLRRIGKPTILSTGMSTMEEISRSVSILGTDDLILTHCTSTYPCKIAELNLNVIRSLQEKFHCPVGYSGHEVGLSTTVAAVCLGACVIERHITLDRAMWGTDHPASVEPWGFMRLVRDIRSVQEALGDGIKKVYPSEIPVKARLRAAALV